MVGAKRIREGVSQKRESDIIASDDNETIPLIRSIDVIISADITS